MVFELAEQGIRNLFRENVRTFLTLIGVIIGIAAIVSLLSIGSGLTVAVNEQFEKLGSNVVYVVAINPTSTSASSVKLTDADVSNIEATPGVSDAVPVYIIAATMEANGEKKNVSIISADAEKAKIFEKVGFFDVKEGRRIQKNESTGIMVAEKFATDGFSKELNVRKTVLINGLEYKIVGIQKQLQQFVGDSNPDNLVIMSLEGLDRLVTEKNPLEIIVTTTSKDNTKDVAERITNDLEKKYGKKSLYIYTSDQLLEQINQIYSLITIFLVGIGIISLIVGGVGIMNAMVSSVMERTKEIGVMKALGASNNTILTIFIIEAGLIGLIGGAIGTLLGYGLAQIIAFVGTSAGFALIGVISLEITLGALVFSMLIGIVSGLLPARRAAEMDPVEALRYE